MARTYRQRGTNQQYPSIGGINLMSYAKAQVMDQITRLQAELDGPLRNVELPPHYSPVNIPVLKPIRSGAAPVERPGRAKPQMSAAARKRISEAQKKRWAARNAAHAAVVNQAAGGTDEAQAAETGGTEAVAETAAPDAAPKRGRQRGAAKGAKRGRKPAQA
jgi:hypothetical protein